jgi:glycosyltransferase involved in cell wall biosynthesis
MAYLYIVAGRFSKGEAFSTRIINFCKILKELDKEVIVISLDEEMPFQINTYDTIDYLSVRSVSNTLIARISNLLFFRNRLKKAIHMLEKNRQIEGVITYDIPANAFLYLKNYCKLNQIKLYHDSIEWYSAEQFKWRQFALPYLLKSLLNKRLIDLHVSVIAISRYLNDYFLSKGINSIRVPVLMDLEEIPFKKNKESEKLILMYAGSPGMKDYLGVILKAISNIKTDKLKQIEFHIFGVTSEELLKYSIVNQDIISKCDNSLFFHGKVSRNKVLEFLKQADFTVLLRSPNLRYAKAGFPTKVVESLATGTPVICNLTSDLGLYLTDSYNSLIVTDCDANSFQEQLEIAINLSITEKQNLSANARKTAEKYFDYRLYCDPLNQFLN